MRKNLGEGLKREPALFRMTLDSLVVNHYTSKVVLSNNNAEGDVQCEQNSFMITAAVLTHRSTVSR